MTLQQLVEALDARIMSGDIVGAFDQFAADQCVTRSNAQDMTQNKAQKLEILNWFFQNISAVNRIERRGLLVSDTVTESEFVFDFVNRQGEPLVYDEVIRRTWKDGKVVEEQYLMGQTIEVPTKSAAKKPTKKEAVSQEVKPAVAKATKATQTAEPKADKKPATKTAAPKTAEKQASKTTKPKAGRK